MHLSKDIHPHKRVLSVFTLVMINVIAVDSLRSLSISAEYGFSLVFYYSLAAVTFFIPMILVTAELATGWPKIGGLYVWVREAFGKRWGFFAICLQWLYNIVWFPTILAFVASSITHLIGHTELADNNIYMLSTILLSFWGATFANCFGMRVSSLICTLGATIGTLLPMAIIITAAGYWLFQGNPSAIEFGHHTFWPDLSHINNLVFFTGIVFSLLGMEMSAVHAEDVKNPNRDYPRALFYSGLLILASLIFASLAVALIMPKQELSLVSGLFDAFEKFFIAFHVPWLSKLIMGMIVLGSISTVTAWIIGPSKGLLAAAEDGCLPSLFCYTTDEGAPIMLLIVQGVIFSLLCGIFVLMPSVNSSYWLLSVLTAQLSMIVYLFMLAAGIKLRYKRPERPGAFMIPGGKIGLYVVCSLGILTCIAVTVLGFLPPLEFEVGNLFCYEFILIVGLLLLCIFPLLIYRKSS